ncbi:MULTISPECIES: hypothetical protein [unclassified Janthinobacterium]|uniref:hypothetical protein n=1 Tax=unclassified Janthinobacterium TaxID=2610881 RepID=UPI001614121C|nr:MULTISPECIES: hypothetical protein [unclassified Janthinobacterium]MBB5606326.1 hypothetical protein [Janthinobacterium sp. S3T4]MBB5611802.1 hypothetical protein [Janthinobacterium sp. S3M3]
MNLLKIELEIPYVGEILSKANMDHLQDKVLQAVVSAMVQSQKLADVETVKMRIEHAEDELSEAKRFGNRLTYLGLPLKRADALAKLYVPEDPYKGEPEKAADSFFSIHGHKYQ